MEEHGRFGVVKMAMAREMEVKDSQVLSVTRATSRNCTVADV